jgi:hypothetical protein
MKVIIAGSRIFGYDKKTKEYNESEYQQLLTIIADSGFQITEVVSGNAHGCDRMGERYAKENSLPVTIFKPKYFKYPPFMAPIERNKEMAFYADALIAVKKGKSPGTTNMVNQMVERQKPVKVTVIPIVEESKVLRTTEKMIEDIRNS